MLSARGVTNSSEGRVGPQDCLLLDGPFNAAAPGPPAALDAHLVDLEGEALGVHHVEEQSTHEIGCTCEGR